jgi:hypothetical protein
MYKLEKVNMQCAIYGTQDRLFYINFVTAFLGKMQVHDE